MGKCIYFMPSYTKLFNQRVEYLLYMYAYSRVEGARSSTVVILWSGKIRPGSVVPRKERWRRRRGWWWREWRVGRHPTGTVQQVSMCTVVVPVMSTLVPMLQVPGSCSEPKPYAAKKNISLPLFLKFSFALSMMSN